MTIPTFTLISPFPPEQYNLAWEWLNEFPEANFDDYGPKTFAEFRTIMAMRAEYETIVGVEVDGELVGILAYLPYTPRTGTLHGICFAAKVHRTGLAFHAVRRFLGNIYACGVDKISAGFHADNRRVYLFLQSLGAVLEGYLKADTMRGGKPIDKYLVAFFKQKETN